MSTLKWLPLTAAFLAGAVLCAFAGRAGNTLSHAADPASSKPDDLAALKGEVARLNGVVPDQSHSMMDVSYHYCNLWFAGQNANWPLAQFYFDETRSHLKWAVRIIPHRKDRDGRDVDLGGILTALEQTSLKDLDQAIKAKDREKFTAAYKLQLTNCMACHKAASKEYIRLRVPERPDANIVEFGTESALGK